MIEINGYKILEKIGTGGMADVFKAMKISDKRIVAIKILKKESSNKLDLVKRFKREGEILGKLKHPNIVKFFQQGEKNGNYYLITEYLGNGNILTTINYDFEFKISVAMDICDALYYAHRANIVHRDLKPSNILLNTLNTPKITDFGIASVLNNNWTQLTKTDMVVGTIAYMSPEQQFRPQNVDSKTDIFAVGAILYQYFTGREAVGRFPLPSELIENFPKELENIIIKCMEYEPEKRFENAGEIAEKLYQFLGGHINLPPVSLFGSEKETVSIKDDFSERITPGLQALKSKYIQEQLDGEKLLKKSVKKEDIPRLYPILDTEDNRVRWVIIEIIGELGNESSIPHIIKYIHIHNLTPYIIKALGKIKGSVALNYLIQLLPKKSLIGYKESNLTREFLPQIVETIGKINPYSLLKFDSYLLFNNQEKVKELFINIVIANQLKLDNKLKDKFLKQEKNSSLKALIKKSP